MSRTSKTDDLQKRKIHRGWIVFAVVGLYYATLSGFMVNSVGVVFAGIIDGMGFSASELSAYYSVKFVVSALIVRRLCRIFDSTRHPNTFMAVTGLIAAASFALMPIYTRPWHWYISAVLVSAASSEMFYIVSVVINNWFAKNQGTLIGMTLMSSGISAAVFSPICSSIISSCGWRASCLVIAGAAIVAWVIPCYILFVRSPEDVGEKPVGFCEAKASEQSHGENSDKATPSENMWPILMLGVSLPYAASVLNNQLATFATSTGYALSVGAFMSSCSMAGNMSFKLLLGVVSDRVGAINATRLFLVVAAVGLVCIINSGGEAYAMYLGALLFGTIFACVATAPSLICKEMYGEKLYKDRLSRIQPVSTMMGAVTSFMYPKIYEMLGTWTPAFALCLLICAVDVISLTVVERHVLRRRMTGGNA